ncbi:MAG: hypothetical protein AAFQ27_10100 [Pseudomonadota bacterium]
MKGTADEVAVYLGICMGSGATGLTSVWGREAIRKRLGMSWRRVDRCVDSLINRGLIEWNDRSARIVRINLKPIETRRMGEGYNAAIERARKGQSSNSGYMRRVDQNATRDGWLDEEGNLIATRKLDPVYLPMALAGDVFGMPTSNPCILERIRKARDPMAFLLLAQMYKAQDLIDLGGSSSDFLWLGYGESTTIWRSATHKVVELSGLKEWTVHSTATADHRGRYDQSDDVARQEDAGRYFERISILKDAGAIEWLIAAVEDEERDAQIIYPLGVMRHGKLRREEPEDEVGVLAMAAALAMKGDANQLDYWLTRNGSEWILPIDRMYRKAVVRGVPRLVKLPRTSATKHWQMERMEVYRAWKDTFSAIISENAPELFEPKGRLQRYLNERSTISQRDLNDHYQSDSHRAENCVFGQQAAEERKVS